MTTRTMIAAMLAGVAVTGAPATAAAGAREDFVACDGMQWPGNDPDGLRADGYTYYGDPDKKLPDLHIAACTRALEARQLTDAMPLRRANLLRGRAIALARKKDYDAALRDVDAALALAEPARQNRFYARNALVSLDLLRAGLLVKLGRGPEAAASVQRVRDSRPWSPTVQVAAAVILDNASPIGTDHDAAYAGALLLDPTDSWVRNSLATHGRWDAIVRRADAPDDRPDPAAQKGLFGDLFSVWRAREKVIALLDTAYARAATGDTAGALRDLEAARRLRTDPPEGSPELRAKLAEDMTRTQTNFDARARVVTARAELAKGGSPSIFKDLVAGSLDKSPQLLDLVGALIARDGDATGALAAARDDLVTRIADRRRDQALERAMGFDDLDARTRSSGIVYKKAGTDVPGALFATVFSLGLNLLSGFDKTSGYSDADHTDGTVTVRYNAAGLQINDLPELVLLRAAELARERGHSGIQFATNDGIQMDLDLAQTANRSAVMSGRFRLVDAATPGALPVDRLIADIAPTYAPPPAAARR